MMASAEFPYDPVSVGAARAFVLRHAGLALDHPVALLVSEIASNALIHAQTGFTISVDDDPGDTVRVEVVDHAPGTPRLKEHEPEAVSGRGLFIVDHLADRWGVEERGDGKAVWFEVERTPSSNGRHLSDAS